MINRNDLGHWRAAICDDCFAALANLGNHSAGMPAHHNRMVAPRSGANDGNRTRVLSLGS